MSNAANPKAKTKQRANPASRAVTRVLQALDRSIAAGEEARRARESLIEAAKQRREKADA